MSGLELYKIVEEFFGNKARMLHFNEVNKGAGCILYESIYLSCNVNGGRFGAEIALGKEAVLKEFLGKHCLPDIDGKSIRESLQIIDDYCRLRLTDKYLEAYEAAQKSKTDVLNFC